MNMFKSRGPRIDTCGIPVIMSYQMLKEEPIQLGEGGWVSIGPPLVYFDL